MKLILGSHTKQILELDDQHGAGEIARRLGCTRQTVYLALKRHRGRVAPPAMTMRIAAITRDEAQWLKGEAQKVGVSWRDLARAMLSDAIAEAKDGKG